MLNPLVYPGPVCMLKPLVYVTKRSEYCVEHRALGLPQKFEHLERLQNVKD